MPKHSPALIHIRIDTQEQRFGIPDLLAAKPQVLLEVTPLQMGDYDVGGDPCRIFERKTATDFLSSLAQGRLFEQLNALLESRFVPILLLEGDPLRVSHSQMRAESIRGALMYINAILHVPILPSQRTVRFCAPGLYSSKTVPDWKSESSCCESSAMPNIHYRSF
jgi:ERCC4-type nuclease